MHDMNRAEAVYVHLCIHPLCITLYSTKDEDAIEIHRNYNDEKNFV